MSAMLVQTTAVQVSLILKGKGKVSCTQKNKTGFHMARTLKKEKNKDQSIMQRNNSFYTVSREALRKKLRDGNSFFM